MSTKTLKRKGSKKGNIELFKQTHDREVCLQYPTHRIWKWANMVTLAEAQAFPIVAERWGNSTDGYVINDLPTTKKK